jgi:hypothetical protein
MGPLAQNPSQSAAWPKPACDWATFGKFGGSGRPSVEIALRWPENRVLKSESDSTHGGHTHPLTEPQSHGDPKIQSLRPCCLNPLSPQSENRLQPEPAVGNFLQANLAVERSNPC